MLSLQMASVRAIVPAPKNQRKMREKIKAANLAIISNQKSSRKGLHVIRLDLPHKDSRGYEAYVFDVSSEEGDCTFRLFWTLHCSRLSMCGAVNM